MDSATRADGTGSFARFGWPNIAYLVFVVAVIAATLAIEGAARRAPDGDGGGVIFGWILWLVVSVPFFAWNLGVAIAALARGRPARTALIGAALPILALLVPLLIGPGF